MLLYISTPLHLCGRWNYKSLLRLRLRFLHKKTYNELIKHTVLNKIKPVVLSLFGLWPLTKKSVSSWGPLSCFRQNISITREKSPPKKKTILCNRTLFLLFFYAITRLMTPQIYFLTLSRGPTPSLGTTGLNCLTICKVVKTSSTSSSYNSKLLLTNWCISIKTLMM